MYIENNEFHIFRYVCDIHMYMWIYICLYIHIYIHKYSVSPQPAGRASAFLDP